MDVILYDGSFEGLLTAVFEIYEYKIQHPVIYKNGVANGSLFGNSQEVQTNGIKSDRVYKKLADKLSKNSLRQLYPAFLSGLKDIENVLFRYIHFVLKSGAGVENDVSNPDVLMILQTSKKVAREKHRMEAFVRFQLTKDQLYYSIIQPDFDVLPLICTHFKTRYADQRWLIYDALRKYGMYYDKEKVEEVTINFSPGINHNSIAKSWYDEEEDLYQQLWRQYFSSVNIAARKNMKLHLQHMPRRYWKYLVEKQ